MDELDALVGDTLISLLRQLRAGYTRRPGGFPASMILCGVRDVRDYRIRGGSTGEVVAGGNAFNIKAKSLRLNDFDRDQVAALLRQHTDETGQAFEPEAVREGRSWDERVYREEHAWDDRRITVWGA